MDTSLRYIPDFAGDNVKNYHEGFLGALVPFKSVITVIPGSLPGDIKVKIISGDSWSMDGDEAKEFLISYKLWLDYNGR